MLLQTDAAMQMHNAMQDSEIVMWPFPHIRTQNQFMVFVVSRDNIAQDTLCQLLKAPASDLKKPLRVRFWAQLLLFFCENLNFFSFMWFAYVDQTAVLFMLPFTEVSSLFILKRSYLCSFITFHYSKILKNIFSIHDNINSKIVSLSVCNRTNEKTACLSLHDNILKTIP